MRRERERSPGAGVVVVEVVVDEGEVVGDHPGARDVTRGDRADGRAGEPELATVDRVDHPHDTGVGGGRDGGVQGGHRSSSGSLVLRGWGRALDASLPAACRGL